MYRHPESEPERDDYTDQEDFEWDWCEWAKHNKAAADRSRMRRTGKPLDWMVTYDR